MLELFSLDDIGQAHGLALAEPERIATTLGKRTNDAMTSFYTRTPNEFLIEYGWGGRTIEPDNGRRARASMAQASGGMIGPGRRRRDLDASRPRDGRGGRAA